MPIGENLKKILSEKSISQYRLSKDSGISQSYLSELINGKYNNPSIDILKKISLVLGIRVAELLEESVS
jgi:XRE family transcriptional regulator of biofilm formation